MAGLAHLLCICYVTIVNAYIVCWSAVFWQCYWWVQSNIVLTVYDNKLECPRFLQSWFMLALFTKCELLQLYKMCKMPEYCRSTTWFKWACWTTWWSVCIYRRHFIIVFILVVCIMYFYLCFMQSHSVLLK